MHNLIFICFSSLLSLFSTLPAEGTKAGYTPEGTKAGYTPEGTKACFPPDQREITVRVNSVKTSAGVVRIAAYITADHFNKTPDYAFVFQKNELKNGVLECRFFLPAGQYAFSILDDIDNNNAMKFNWMGLPAEGFGFSNDANLRVPLGPSFQESKISVGTSRNAFSIKMRYM